MENLTEKLIENVKKHQILFDFAHPDYKNVRMKNKIWDEIARHMDLGITGGDDLKKRWKNLRDCYSKYLRSEKTRTGQKAKFISRYKAWPWAQHMEIFRPFLKFAETESNVSNPNIGESQERTTEETESSNELNELAAETIEDTSKELSKEQEGRPPKTLQTGQHGKKRKLLETATSQTSSVDKIISYLDTKHTDIRPRYEELDLLFQGYAASVKSLSPRRQTLIKFKFAKIIMEEELSQHAEMEAKNRSKTSSSFQSSNCSNTFKIPR